MRSVTHIDGHITIGIGVLAEATAKDIDAVAGTCGSHIGKDVHYDITLHQTIDIGTAVDACEVGIGCGIVDLHVTIRYGSCARTFVATLTTTIDGAVQCVTADGKRGEIGWRSAVCVDRTQSRAAVEVTVNGCTIQFDVDVSRRCCSDTQTAAIDIGCLRRRTDCTAIQVDSDLAADSTFCIATAIDAIQYAAAVDVHCGTTYASLVTAAIDIVTYITIRNGYGRRACICSQVAATKDVANIPAAGRSILIDIHCYGTIDGATGVVAAKDIVHHTAVDVQRDIRW